MKINSLTLLISLSITLISTAVVAQDNLKGSWMPDTEQTGDFKQITAFLKSLGGSFRPMLVSYDGSVVREKAVFNQGKATLHTSEWSCDLKPVKPNRDVLDLEICFNVDKGELQSGGIAVAFDFKDWSRDNFVLIPAYVYNGNRFNVETNGLLLSLSETLSV